jgi:hypothetical protein
VALGPINDVPPQHQLPKLIVPPTLLPTRSSYLTTMSCSSCQRRKLVCDLLRPRCAQCRRSHLKCEFKPSNAIQFQDETEIVKARSFSAKRHKKSNTDTRVSPTDASSSGVSLQLSTGQFWQAAGSELPFIDNTSFIPWVDDIFEGYLPDSSGASQLWQDIADSALFPDLIFEETTNLENSDAGLDTLNRVSNTSISPVETHDPESLQKPSQNGISEGPLEEIPDHFLAQHYTRNLTGRYSSKDRGWNYYAHFYHRFTNSHPFVLAALYAWTSAHLFFAGNLKSLHNAFRHYERCLEQISIGHSLNIDILSSQAKAGIAQTNLLDTLSDDDVDAIGVSMYFLASTDLLASRRTSLQNLVQAMAALHLAGLPARRRKGLFSTVSSWFCFLDARLCIFGMGHCSLMNLIGGEEGMVAGINSTSDFLRQEYKILYPAEEIKRDEAHLPLLEILVRLVANFGLISNFLSGENDPALRDTVKISLDKIKKVV